MKIAVPARVLNISPGGLLLEISAHELEGVVFAVDQRLEVTVPVLNGGKNRSSQIEYKVEVVRVEASASYVRVACSTLRARLCRRVAMEKSSYAM